MYDTQAELDAFLKHFYQVRFVRRLGEGAFGLAILVYDGIATGASMLAAVRAVRGASPQSIVVAVPVGPQSACRQLAMEADDVVCATMPVDFDAVGQVYADFHQVSDDEVIAALRRFPANRSMHTGES